MYKTEAEIARAKLHQELKYNAEILIRKIEDGSLQSEHIDLLERDFPRMLRMEMSYLNKIAQRSIEAGCTSQLKNIIPDTAQDICIGDLVIWRNDYGVLFPSLVVGFALDHVELNRHKEGDDKHCIYLLKDNYWYPIAPSSVIEVVRFLKHTI